MADRILGTPVMFIKQSMESSAYPFPGSVAWNRMPLLYERLQKYDNDIGLAVDDLYDAIEWLRETKSYAQSDRIRTIAGRLARARRYDEREGNQLIRVMARSWPDPLSSPSTKETE